MLLKDKLRIGCSGWGYDDWLGGFYPKDTPKSDYLKLYSGVFDSVEVDSSFYRNPGPATTKGWYKSTAWLSVLDEDAAADHAREEAQGRRGEPRLVLHVGEGTAREGRAPRRAAPALDQVRLPLGAHEGLRQGLRDEVSPRSRVPAQVVVPRRGVRPPAGPERRDGVDREPVPAEPDGRDRRLRVPADGRGSRDHRVQGDAERQVRRDAGMVQGARRGLGFGQGRPRVLQQPLRGIRARQRQRVPAPRRHDGVRVPLEGAARDTKRPRGLRLIRVLRSAAVCLNSIPSSSDRGFSGN